MTVTMDASTINTNRYLGKTRSEPRPSRETHPRAPDDWLRAAQRAWDAAEAWAKGNDRLRDERLTRLDEEREQKRAEAHRRDEDAFVATLRTRYLAADPSATEADFQADLPEIRRRHRIDQALRTEAPDAAARAAQTRLYG